MLEYADEGEDTFSIEMKKMQGCWGESEEEGTRSRKVQRFRERVEWGKEEKEETGGTTWIEMYAWYTIHGGQEEKEEERGRGPLRKTPMLQQHVAELKKDIMRIKSMQCLKNSKSVHCD